MSLLLQQGLRLRELGGDLNERRTRRRPTLHQPGTVHVAGSRHGGHVIAGHCLRGLVAVVGEHDVGEQPGHGGCDLGLRLHDVDRGPALGAAGCRCVGVGDDERCAA